MRTDPSTNTVYIEYTDVLLLISTYIRRYKFTNNNQMPDCVVVEVPQRAWDLKTQNSTECESYQVEGEPPEKWFSQAVKHELQAAPEVVEQQTVQSVPEPGPDTPLHTDEMVMEVGAEHVRLTPTQAPLNTRPEPIRPGEIENMTGEVEDFELDLAPLDTEEEAVGSDQIHSISDRHERAEGDADSPEPVSTSDPDAIEPDGNE